jgi:long-chain acyl-CoA synthetase
VRALGAIEARRVGVLAANSLAHLECWLGLPAFGKVLVDLNYRLSVEELAFMVGDAELDVLIVDPERREVGEQLGVPLLEDYEAIVAGPEHSYPDVDEAALAAISYTGGTTGAAKGVMLSHRNLLANALHNLAVTGHTREDRWLHVCPMFHVAGTSNVFACTWVGARQVLLPRFEAASVLAAIARERITHTVFVPTMLAMLLEHAEGADVSSVRHLQYAASPISPELQRRVLDWLPGCDVVQFYGMTEAAPTVTRLSARDHRERPASMGVPVPGVQAEVRAPRGEVGEVWVRGPNVMLGYWNRPEATAEALVDGWYRTGDLAREDEDGYLYMVDRAKDMIITGAENVYSVEVEAVLDRHPAVDEVAVFGVPDERWGEAVHAVVVPSAAVTVEELIAHCRASLGGFKVPRTIELRDEPLPKSGAGKLLKNRLREPHWAGRERSVH